MRKLKIAILGASEIAMRRFMPAIKSIDNFEFYGVAVATKDEKEQFLEKVVFEYNRQSSIEKARKFIDLYGGQVIKSYSEVLESEEIDAVYIPLPPALHYYWAKSALKSGKHVFLEKPFTISLDDTNELIKIAKAKELALFENYGFEFHKQMSVINDLISKGEIGEVRQIRTAFGFPYRGASDFRYSKELGGGALFDCGGYPIKLSTILLGETAKVTSAALSNEDNHEVDIYGSTTMIGEKNVTSQISFGMDNYYKCELEIWGSKGIIFAPRVFTAPSELSVEIILHKEKKQVFNVPRDDQFMNAIKEFFTAISSESVRQKYYKSIIKQSIHVNDVLRISSKEGSVKNV